VLANRRKNDQITNGTQLDAVNRGLLAELTSDARLSLAELGRRVGLSAPAVAERIQRLQETGVVRGFRAELDPRALGYSLGVVLRIRPEARHLRTVAQRARESPEVVECHRITGDDCYFMKLHVVDIEHLEEVIDRFTPYGQTTTSIIQSSPVTGRSLPLDPPSLQDGLPADRPSA
jgi:Lrp/AsnC family transcriptional regulator, leucine-responsive regulatory protein